MVKHVYDNILNSKADVICHQVNCQNVMGSGLALQIKRKYPVVYQEYKSFCNKKTPSDLLGSVQIVDVGDQFVANCFGQLNYGTKKCHTDYKALETCFLKIKDLFPHHVIAFPYKIGCGLAGGDWSVVLGIIKNVFADYAGTIEIYQL